MLFAKPLIGYKNLQVWCGLCGVVYVKQDQRHKNPHLQSSHLPRVFLLIRVCVCVCVCVCEKSSHKTASHQTNVNLPHTSVHAQMVHYVDIIMLNHYQQC